MPVGWLGYATQTGHAKLAAPARPRRRRPRRRTRPWGAIPDRVRERLQKRVRRPDGRFVPRVITAADIPPGVRVVLDPQAALEAFDTHPATSTWRSDRYRHWRAVWRALTCRIDWRTGGITTTHALLAQAAGDGVSVGTVRRVIAWAKAAGLLYVVETGASAAVLGTEVNRAPTYAILSPMGDKINNAIPVEINAHPPGSRSEPVTEVDGYYRYDGQDQRRGPQSTQRPRQLWAMRRTPQSAAAQLEAARTLRSIAGWSDIGDEQLRRILARWFAAGWCLTALVRAIDESPDGHRWPAPPPTAQQLDRWRYDAEQAGKRDGGTNRFSVARRRAAWLCWRLRHWLDPVTGQPLPPPVRAVEPLERVVLPIRQLGGSAAAAPVLTAAGESARAAARAIAKAKRRS